MIKRKETLKRLKAKFLRQFLVDFDVLEGVSSLFLILVVVVGRLLLLVTDAKVDRADVSDGFCFPLRLVETAGHCALVSSY